MEARDTSIRTETPEGIEYVLYPAGLPIRSCAYGIDVILQWIILIIVNLAYRLVLHTMMGVWLILLCQFILNWFYHVIWELWFQGQSPGKRILGIRVVCGDGSPVDPGSSILRNLIRFIDSFMGLFLIGFVSVSAGRGFRRLGDWAAGTLVIHTWQSQAPERREPMNWLADFPAAVPGRVLSYEEKQGILMFARRYPLLGTARAGEIARPLAESLHFGGETDPAAAKYLLGIARTLEAP